MQHYFGNFHLYIMCKHGKCSWEWVLFVGNGCHITWSKLKLLWNFLYWYFQAKKISEKWCEKSPKWYASSQKYSTGMVDVKNRKLSGRLVIVKCDFSCFFVKIFTKFRLRLEHVILSFGYRTHRIFHTVTIILRVFSSKLNTYSLG